jgi:lysozyme
MKMTNEGLALIKRFEGFRHMAYRDPVGVWTIGYGHTSMAGPPTVKAGLEISLDEAHEILRRDVAQFEHGVSTAVKVPLSDPQFSALVSFAYNVGLGAFRKSSVLAAVNARDFSAVPRRLNLWNKAGGRVLAGLVRRRAAEGALFAGNEDAEVRAPVEVAPSKPVAKSKTIWSASIILALAVVQSLMTTTLQVTTLLVLLMIAAAVGLIIYERFRKLKEEAL